MQPELIGKCPIVTVKGQVVSIVMYDPMKEIKGGGTLQDVGFSGAEEGSCESPL